MVVLEGGKPKTSDYRRFRIKTIEGQNDAGSLQEVLRRRFKRLLATPNGAAERSVYDVADGDVPEDTELPNEEGASPDAVGDPWAQLPNLIIVDGGRPQLSAALAVLADLEVGVPAIGIAKEDHGQISTHEEIYLVEQPEPLILPRGSQGLYLLQRIRDEAHRFAITYHRQVRSTKTLRSVLCQIPGLRPQP